MVGPIWTVDRPVVSVRATDGWRSSLQRGGAPTCGRGSTVDARCRLQGGRAGGVDDAGAEEGVAVGAAVAALAVIILVDRLPVGRAGQWGGRAFQRGRDRPLGPLRGDLGGG